MKSGRCQCGNRLFFGNSVCLKCCLSVGRCSVCEALTGFSAAPGGNFTCTRCQAVCGRCTNQAQQACNSFVSPNESLCAWCRFTQIAPDQSKPENIKRWVELERAKRRLLVELKALSLPPFIGNLASTHPLSFQFLEDEVFANGTVKKIYTGHEAGVIVVNIKEADSVYRERARVALGEPQRTLIGHLRHEIGHYIDWCYAGRVASEGYRNLFGDPLAFDYDDARRRYYTSGPPATWGSSYVSAYATMHPWEDFAETVNVYLDIMAIADTANTQGTASIDLSPSSPAEAIVQSVLDVAVNVSEFNLDIGLLPLLPEKFSAKVIEKMTFIHCLRSDAVIAQLTKQTPSLP